MTGSSGFSYWFIKHMSQKKVTLSCPASEMITNKDVELSSRREDWLHLVKAEQVRVVLLIFLQHNFFFAYLVGNSNVASHTHSMVQA